MATGHGGNLRELAARSGRDAAEILDFSASVNPLGPPEGLRAALTDAFARLVHYPDPRSAELAAAIAAAHRIAAARIVVGNGSSELLFALARACDYDARSFPAVLHRLRNGHRAGRPRLRRNASAGRAGRLPAGLDFGSRVARGRIGPARPAEQPDGASFDRCEFLAVAVRRPATTFVVDEAFADFLAGYVVGRRRPGQRDRRPLLHQVLRYRPPARVCRGLLAAGGADRRATDALVSGHAGPSGRRRRAGGHAYARRTVAEVGRLRGKLIERLRQFPRLHVYPGEANFLLRGWTRPKPPRRSWPNAC